MSITEETALLVTPQALLPITGQVEPSLIADIVEVKQEILSWTKEKILTEAAMLQTKEVKDLMAIIDTLEKSIKPKDENPVVQVNVLVQSLMEAKDDC